MYTKYYIYTQTPPPKKGKETQLVEMEINDNKFSKY